MNTQHAKSICCHASICHYGHKRRQCCRCKRTWTIRPKKRGRPYIRLPTHIFNQIFLERLTLQHLAQRRPHVPLLTFRHRFRQALVRFVARPAPQKFPRGPLTLLADGLRFHFHRRPWVLYLTAVKSCTGKTAIFLDPLLIPGQEGAFRWEQVFAAIPLKLKRRILALVVDNLNGMKKISKRNQWVLQLCQFHLIRKLQVQWKRPHRTLKGGAVREELYQLIRHALDAPEGPSLRRSLVRLMKLSQTRCGTQRIRAVVRYFLKSVNQYRTYQEHPELDLPITTNSVESMACVIRDLLRRTRCASSPKALIQWATALIRLRPTITCNGKHFNRLN